MKLGYLPTAYNNSQDIWDLFLFSCEIAHNGKSLISAFEEFCASAGKPFVLAGAWSLGYHFMWLRQSAGIS